MYRVLNAIKSGFSWAGNKIKTKINSFRTRHGWFTFFVGMAANKICLKAAQMIIYCNGGKMHMEKRKARCGELVELDKYSNHLQTCKECILRGRLLSELKTSYDKIKNDYIQLKEEEQLVKDVLTDVEIAENAMRILKLMLKHPTIAKKVQNLYDKNKHLIEPDLKEEEELSRLKDVGNKLSRLKQSVSENLKKIGLKTKIKTWLSKLKHKFSEARKRTRAIIYAFLTTVLPSLIANLVFGIDLMSEAMKAPYISDVVDKIKFW